MYITLLISGGLLFFFLHFPEHRREMIWAGVLSVPLSLLWVAGGYGVNQEPIVILLGCSLRAILSFSLAAVIAAFYEMFFYKHLKLKPHPHRAKLAQLVLGPIVFLGLALSFQQFAVYFLFIGFLAEITILVYHRKELLSEAIVSGLLMGTVYLFAFLLVGHFASDSGLSIWMHGLSGLNFLGLPVEELLFVFGYGLLWGPLYEGVKREQL